MICKEKIDIHKLFADLDMSKDKALDVNELGKFLMKVDKDITRQKIDYIRIKPNLKFGLKIIMHSNQNIYQFILNGNAQQQQRNGSYKKLSNLPHQLKSQDSIHEKNQSILEKLKLSIQKQKKIYKTSNLINVLIRDWIKIIVKKNRASYNLSRNNCWFLLLLMKMVIAILISKNFNKFK
ncbi:unnamed protein product [Paramecium pentaurelia]|uniref:EF-hand domain-containing protein n=1 Tax=Paramecium pentaurelia TaxID=43138 RepID=A0A8S1VZ51_9CILI|nr:unnamed protein product [Paramecium pentaurelia]